MQDSALSVLLSRLDFAWITSMHILYPPLTVGLAMLLFFAEWRWVRTNDEQWYRLVRFFEKLFILNFGAGVATGITMEMAFGILYGPFSQAAGPFLGQVLGYETISAFMYEAGFLGLMVFGWGKNWQKDASVCDLQRRCGFHPLGLVDPGCEFLDADPHRCRVQERLFPGR